MSDEVHISRDPDDRPITRKEFRLELKAVVAQLRLLIIASVALNQFLTNVTLPTEVAVPAILAAIFAPALKGLLVFARH